ncbi:sigma 54 modulation/S30EA ribosomal C-terminal domain-containing protein [Amycolatopsis benzoatilytica]|uniref:sigma 54 modulation/S30EA ribosomal C-terminal domain-containing protein n=1 Tax=Amycolatopsis benzoatilytica TaxID=346045 RepID=UPI00036D17BE|nr:sigma 54 modulation/S30EA ribosomal C-terminal domain-containing protein [Amycolatopsis benzoatilytica]
MTRPSIVVRTSGEVPDAARDDVLRQIGNFAGRIDGEVAAVRIRLTAVRRPAAALTQVNLNVDGRALRAQAAAGFFPESATLVQARLRAHLVRMRAPEAPRAWPDAEQRHRRPPLVAVSPPQRRIVRRKRLALLRCRPDEAALAMDLMDYDFLAFVDADTGEDSLVARAGPTGYRLSRVAARCPPHPPAAHPWTVDVHPVPLLTAGQAAGRLDTTEMPYRFFRDAATGRGSVLYLRYDGHYGLLAPAGTGRA